MRAAIYQRRHQLERDRVHWLKINDQLLEELPKLKAELARVEERAAGLPT